MIEGNRYNGWLQSATSALSRESAAAAAAAPAAPAALVEERTTPVLRVVPAAPSPPVDSNGRAVDLAAVPPSFAARETACRGATTTSPAPSGPRGRSDHAAPPASGAAEAAADPAATVGNDKTASRVGNVASRGGGARTVVVTESKSATDATTGTTGAAVAAATSRGCNTAAAAVAATEGVADGGGIASPPPTAATVSIDADTSMAVDAVDAGVLPTPFVAADRGAEDVDPHAVEGAAFSEGGPGGRDTFGRGAARLEEAVCDDDDDGAERLSLSLDLETLPLPCLSGHSTWQHERALFRGGKGSGRCGGKEEKAGSRTQGRGGGHISLRGGGISVHTATTVARRGARQLVLRVQTIMHRKICT